MLRSQRTAGRGVCRLAASASSSVAGRAAARRARPWPTPSHHLTRVSAVCVCPVRPLRVALQTEWIVHESA